MQRSERECGNEKSRPERIGIVVSRLALPNKTSIRKKKLFITSSTDVWMHDKT